MFEKLVNEKIISNNTVLILKYYDVYNVNELKNINIDYLVKNDKRVTKDVLKDIINILIVDN